MPTIFSFWLNKSQLKRNAFFLLKVIISFLLLNCFYLLLLVSVQSFDKRIIRARILAAAEKGGTDRKCAWNKTFPYERVTDTLTEYIALTINLSEPLEATKENFLETALLSKAVPICSPHYIEFLKNGKVKDNKGKRIKYTGQYHRYWHGYQAYLKPLLRFMTIFNIRFLFHFLIIVLIFILLNLLQNSPEIKIAFMAIFFLLPFFVNILDISLLTSSLFAIILASLIAFILFLRYKINHERSLIAFFFFSGSILNYFDFLIAPQLNPTLLGYILVLSLYAQKDFQYSKKRIFFLLSLCVLAWFGGYFLTYVMKWIFTAFILPVDIIYENIYYVKYRIMGLMSKETPIPAISITWHQLRHLLAGSILRLFVCMCLACVFIIFFIFTYIRAKNKKIMLQEFLLLSAPLLVLILWSELVRNHTYIHAGLNRFGIPSFIFIIPLANLFFLNAFYRKNKV